ncbi:Down syndrome cell adhesion molecule homolog [Ixodes scapularis]
MAASRIRGTLVVRQNYAAEAYDEFVISGNTAVMRCQVPAFVSDYVTVTSWIEEPTGNVIKQASPSGSSKYHMFPEGELYIRDVDKSLSYRSYRCQTKDKLTGESTRSSLPGRLIITETHTNVPPRMAHSRQRVTATIGDTATLPCAAQGSPPPQYRWYRDDGSPVFLDQRTSQVDGVLVVRKATLRDAGKFTCVANNSAGDDRASSELVITEPLTATIQPPRQQVHVGQTAIIKCAVSGHPVAAIVWRFNQRPLPISDRVSVPSADTVHIRSVKKEDKGMYQCFVHNEVDAVQAGFELSLAEDLPEFQDTFRPETVHPGTRFSLKCSASGNPLPQITWSLDESAVPETHRVRFGDYVTQAGVVVSYLNFSVVQVEDGGDYRCTANNGVGTVLHTARINVPGRPVVRPMRNLTVVAGEIIKLRCPVAGYPLESINWEREGVRLPYNHRQKVHDNGTLEVHHVERATDEGPYSCVAKDREGHSAQNTIYITVKVKPTIEPFSYPSSLREGQRSSVMCTVISGDLPINITWFKDDQPITASNPGTAGILVNTVSDYSSTLLFKSLRLDYRGNYTCVAANEAGTVSHSAVMIIHVPPQWIIEPSETSVVKGRSAVIDCEADGFPMPRIRWTKAEGDAARDFKPVVSSAHVQVFENGSLAINDAKEEDAGFFLCQASNGIGQGLSKVVKVTVHIAAHFKSKFSAEMIRKGQNTRLKCDATGDKPMRIAWMKDKLVVNPKQDPRYELVETIQTTGVTSEILIRQTDRRDSALFTCVATNNFGHDDTNIQLIVQEPPDAPQDLKAMETTSRSVKLVWTAPYSGNSPITHYTVQYKDDGSPGGPPTKVRAQPTSSRSLKITWNAPNKELHFGIIQGYYIGYRVAATSEPYIYKTLESEMDAGEGCVLTGLSRFTQYSVIVQAYNKKGAGPPSDEVVVQTLDSDPPSAPYLHAEATSFTSVSIKWERQSGDQNPVAGYVVRHKESGGSGDWHETRVQGDQNALTIGDLKCGSAYQFTVRGYNAAGAGDTSDVLTVKTSGAAPVPPDRQSLLHYNATRAVVQLSTWHSGGCPIQQFTVKYRRQKDLEWTTLQTGLLRDKRLEIRDLSPGTWYTLQMTAHNSAGVTEAEYAFATLSKHGGYVVRHKESGGSGDWHETRVQGDQNALTIGDLKCGSAYQFTVRGYNAAGAGDTSDVLTVKTSGAAPVPPDRQSLLHYNATRAVVQLSTWHSGGCPIQQFTVKYRRQKDLEWTTLQTGLLRDKRLEIRDLSPGTWYTLQMTAHNSAGVTEAEYAFATLSKHGAADQVTPRTEVHRETSSVVSDATVVIPVVVSILVVIALLVVVCMVVRKKHSSGSSQSGTYANGSSLYGTRKNGMQEAMQMTDLEGKVGKECSTSAFFPAPYATTHLGTRGPEKRADHQDEPLYATVKRTPRPPRSDGHIYQCPALARNGRPAARVT